MADAATRRTMKQRAYRRRSLIALVPLGVLLAGLTQVVIALRANSFAWTDDVMFSIVALPFGIVGALIVANRGHNTISWIFCSMSALWAAGALAEEWLPYAFARSGASASTTLAAWFGEWYWLPFIALMTVFVPLLFPTGKVVTRRWRHMLRFAVAFVTAFTVLAALDPRLEIIGSRDTLPNPIGISPLGDIEQGPESGAMFLTLITMAIAAVSSLFIRLRRSGGVERQQIKWFVYGTAVLVGGFISFAVADSLGVPRPILDVAYSVVFAVPPIAAGLAIMRYRLYDIDVLINRTLVYGVLTLALGIGYSACIVLFQRVLPIADDSDIGVAASTLAVAAAFRPARARVQRFIDRRFYRSRYDATEILGAFSERVRHQVELDGLRTTLLQSVADTMQPSRVSVWLREAPMREAIG